MSPKPNNRKPEDQMRKYFMGVVVLLVALAGASTSKGQSLVNGGFETGSFSGWTVAGNSPNFGVGTAGTVITGTYPPFGTTTVLVHSGSYAGYAVVCSVISSTCKPSGNINDYLDLSQVISVVPGDTYTAGLYVAANGSSFGYGSNIGISIDGTPIVVPQLGVSSTYQFFSGTFSTLDPTPTITFHINGSGNADAGFSFDDLSVTGPPASVTPEPQSLVLFATGLLGIFSRLKRTAIS
jgi:hypothetical protein